MRVALVQLGCPKNWVDGEWMLGQARAAGHEVVRRRGRRRHREHLRVHRRRQGGVRRTPSSRWPSARRTGRRNASSWQAAWSSGTRTNCARPSPKSTASSPSAPPGRGPAPAAHPDLEVPVIRDVALYDGLRAQAPRHPAPPGLREDRRGVRQPLLLLPHPHLQGPVPLPSGGGHRARGATPGRAVSRRWSSSHRTPPTTGADLGMKEGLAKLLHRLQTKTEVPWIRVLYAYPNHLSGAASWRPWPRAPAWCRTWTCPSSTPTRTSCGP